MKMQSQNKQTTTTRKQEYEVSLFCLSETNLFSKCEIKQFLFSLYFFLFKLFKKKKKRAKILPLMLFSIFHYDFYQASPFIKSPFFFPCWGQSQYRTKQILISFFFLTQSKWWEETCRTETNVFPPSLFYFF